RWELAWSRAGHLPIVHVRDGVPTALLEPAGPLVGLSPTVRTGDRRTLEPGDVLLFYTDGLIERRDPPPRAGLDALPSAPAGLSPTVRTGDRRTLEPGDVLLFYTDGLIERRDRPLRAGLNALLSAAAGLPPVDAAGIGEDLLVRLADAPEDDVALVVVRVPDP